MRVSIALCTYNGAKYLREQLDSYVAQTRKPDEMVVVDDGSKDDTLRILQEFAASAPFPVRIYCNETNLGVSANFIKAMGLCEAEVVFPSDQDDVWHPKKIEKMLLPFSDVSVNLVACNAKLVDQDLRPSGKDLWQAVRFVGNDIPNVQAGLAYDILLERNFVAGMAMAVRKNFIPLAGTVPEVLVHDAWLAVAASIDGGVRVVPEELVLYRLHGSNVIGVQAVTRWDHFKEALKLRTERLLERAAQLQSILDGLGNRLSPARKEFLAQRVAHYRARGTMPQGRRARLPMVVRELVSGRYNRFSMGLLAAVRDMVR